MFRLFISGRATRVLPETECHPNPDQNVNQIRSVLISVYVLLKFKLLVIVVNTF